MQSSTYKDIIDEKIAEWQASLKKIQQQADKASLDSKASAKIKDLKSAIDSAIVQMQALDAQETIGNTMETKNQILKIFTSIDKEFTEFQGKTPFML